LLKFTDNKDEQVKRVFWTLFVGMAGLVLARVVDRTRSWHSRR
jgi:hypothetical protein